MREPAVTNERHRLDHDDENHDERRERISDEAHVSPRSAILDDTPVKSAARISLPDLYQTKP